MQLQEAIAQRHSYRGPFREDRSIPREHLRRIAEAGLLAPSGCNRQTTRFAIIDDPRLISNIRSLHPTNQAMRTAPAFIACTIARQPDRVYESFSFEIEDCAAAVENMLLAIVDLGYASVWIDGWLRAENRAETMGEWLHVPKSRVIRVILPVGLPCEPPAGPEKQSFAERADFNRHPAE